MPGFVKMDQVNSAFGAINMSRLLAAKEKGCDRQETCPRLRDLLWQL